MKALSINVYRTERICDCTNGGVSSRHNTLYVVCEEGCFDIDEDDERLMVLSEGYAGSVHLRPYKMPDAGHVGWMFGGNFGHSSDSRFGRLAGMYGAVAIHDRQETFEEYEMLSR